MPAWTWWSQEFHSCRLWLWILASARITKCCTPKRTWRKLSSITWGVERPLSASSVTGRLFRGLPVQQQSTPMQRQEGCFTPQAAVSFILMFFKINTSFSKNLCVIFQFYVGGNAALIAQKLATYPDLMVDQQFDISVLNTYTTFHLFRSISFLLW